jgi:hypothetical protein
MKAHHAPPAVATLLAFCAVSLAICCSACGSLGTRDQEPEGVWIEKEVEAATSNIVRETVMGALERLHYPVGSGYDKVAREIESAWQTHLGAFKGQGFRRQAIVRYGALEPGLYQVGVRVRRQTNESVAAPTDPSRAEWKWSEDDTLAATILMQHILSGFAVDLEMTPEDENPYGLP